MIVKSQKLKNKVEHEDFYNKITKKSKAVTESVSVSQMILYLMYVPVLWCDKLVEHSPGLPKIY